MDAIWFGRSRFETVKQAARWFADGLLPDPSVISPDEDAESAAEELVVFFTAEAARMGESLGGDELPAELADEFRAELVARLATMFREAQEEKRNAR